MISDRLLKHNLVMWAKEYNNPLFIDDDPIQFPRKYKSNQVDAEISGLLTALISFGNRKQIIKKAKELDDMFNGSPYKWIYEKRFEKDIPYNNASFYRTIDNSKFKYWCYLIHNMIVRVGQNGTIEQYIKGLANESNTCVFHVLRDMFYHSRNTSAKRIAMFLRWMVRNDGIVDLGLWKTIDSKDLIIPLDTHVHRMALELGITKRKTTDIKTAREITDYFKTIWPNDPCLGDFALFGYGINNK